MMTTTTMMKKTVRFGSIVKFSEYFKFLQNLKGSNLHSICFHFMLICSKSK